jgi:hypothetical protein
MRTGWYPFAQQTKGMQSIRRDYFERQFVPDAHNDNAVASPRMSRSVDCCGYVQDGALLRSKQQDDAIDLKGSLRRFVPDAHNDDAVTSPQMPCFVSSAYVQDRLLLHNKQ